MTDTTHQNALRAGRRLHWYVVERLLGQGAFGITYLARDVNLGQRVAIKEYLPSELATRDGQDAVRALSPEHEQTFRWGLERFMDEGRVLAGLDHPSLVRVHAVFEENGTAYMVMRYEEGDTLRARLQARGTLPETEILRFLTPLLHGVETVHEQGLIHRDIKPANIFLRRDGSPVLLDFGSARHVVREQTTNLTALVSPGYAPLEQYSGDSRAQGPWTDVYGLAATLYHCVSGRPPLNALERSTNALAGAPDGLVPAREAGAGAYRDALLAAIDRGLALQPEQRPRSIPQWQAMLERAPPHESRGVRAIPTEIAQAPTVRLPESAPARKARLVSGLPGLVVGLTVLAAASAAWWYGWPVPAQSVSGAAPAEDTRSIEQPDTPARVVALLEAARADLEAGRLTRPEGANAFARYRAALRLDKDNAGARQGIRHIIEHYVREALAAEARREYQRAIAHLDEILTLMPDSQALRAARRRLVEEARSPQP